MNKFKESKYNIIAKDENTFIMYNTLTGAMVALEENKFNLFKDGAYASLGETDFNALLRMGFITCYDEFELLEKNRLARLSREASDTWNLVILTTSACNARCYYCYEKGIKNKTMDETTANSIVEYIVQNHSGRDVKISWFGGEPLVNKKIISYICECLKNNNIKYRSTMISNGYLFKQTSPDELKLWNLRNVQITLDSIGDEYNKIKNFFYEGDSFSEIIKNIHYLIELKIFVTVRINFDPRNLEAPKRILSFLREEFNDKHLKAYLANIVANDVPSPIECDVNPYIELYDYMFKLGYINNIHDLKFRQKLYDCSIYDKSFVIINPDGKLFKCEHALVDDVNSYGVIGTDEEITEIRDFWERFDYSFDECKTCKCLPLCEGGCKYYKLTEGKRNTCIQIKNCMEELIKLYYKNERRVK